jgi:hypothetical protein
LASRAPAPDPRLEDGRWVLLATHRDTDVVRVEPFEAIEIELPALWPDA